MTSQPFNPFLFHSHQLNKMFVSAKQQKNQAWWLYEHGARNTLFMLEALTRIHGIAFEKKVYHKWNNRFKKLEDAFGTIDYYFVLEKEFKKNKLLKPTVLNYFTNNKLKFIEACDQRLCDKKWLTQRLSSFNLKFTDTPVVYDNAYINGLKLAITKDIAFIKLFCTKRHYVLTQFEEEVHELRRKLRWLSIYAQAFNGLIQLKATASKPPYTIRYFTKAVLASPYNLLAAKPKKAAVIEYRKYPFLALSWLIQELGVLKDNGLKIQALTSAFIASEGLTESDAKKKALKALALPQDTEKVLLKKASELMYTFMVKDKVLDELLIQSFTS